MYTTADWSSRFLRNITSVDSEYHRYWKERGEFADCEDGRWWGWWSWSPCTAKESWDQGCLCSASDRASCIAHRNSWFPGSAGNLLTGIQLYPSQADVTAAALSQDSDHILSSVPTGWGKTLPMLLAALLMPPGDTIPNFYDFNNWFISPQAQQPRYWCPLQQSPSSWRQSATSWVYLPCSPARCLR